MNKLGIAGLVLGGVVASGYVINRLSKLNDNKEEEKLIDLSKIENPTKEECVKAVEQSVMNMYNVPKDNEEIFEACIDIVIKKCPDVDPDFIRKIFSGM